MAEVERGSRAVVATLLALALLRALTTFLPSMWAWGINIQRFLVPWLSVASWALMVAALLPGVGARLSPTLERAGTRWAERTPWLPALAAALLVWLLPDRTWFTGDFLLRQGAAETGALASVYTQALPLEHFFNQTLPQSFGPYSRLDPNVVTRSIEAVAAAALAWAACRLARAWSLTGAAAATAAAIVFFGGYLAFFTGLGKPAALQCVLTAIVLLGASRLLRTGQGGLLLGASLAVALLLHRSGLALIPLWVVTLVLARRAPSEQQPSRADFALAAALPLLAAVIAAPSLWHILTTFDLPRHVRAEGAAERGLLALAFAPLHLADLANLLLFYTPALMVAGALALVARGESTAEDRVLPWVLAASFIPLLLFIHPLQGIIRDLEVFAPAGIAMAAVSGRVIGEALERRRLGARLAPALFAAVAIPALQWLVHFHDPAFGYARARAIALEAPVRPDIERARLWDLLAYRAFREHRWDQALEATDQSVRIAAHPRAVIMLAIARTYTGNYRGAESLYVGLAEKTPEDPLVWVGLGGVAVRLSDTLWARRALERLSSYPPRSAPARVVRRHLDEFPEVWPGAPPASGTH